MKTKSKKPVKQEKSKKPVKPAAKKETRTAVPGKSEVKEISISGGRVSCKLLNVRIDFVNLKAPRKNSFGGWQYSIRIGFFGDLLGYLGEPLAEAINTGSPKKWTESKWVALGEKEIERIRANALAKLPEKYDVLGNDHFADAVVLNASANAEQTGPNTFKPKSKIFVTPSVEKIYSGCWADVAVTFSLHANDGGGLTVYLDGVRFVADDTDLGASGQSNPWGEEADEIGESYISEQSSGEESTYSESSSGAGDAQSDKEVSKSEQSEKTGKKRFFFSRD